MMLIALALTQAAISLRVVASPPMGASAPAGTPSPQPHVSLTYPEAALRERREGIVVTSVTVGVDGNVRNCDVVSSSGSPDLDAAGCAAMMSSTGWAVAHDGAGKPVESQIIKRINFKLPPPPDHRIQMAYPGTSLRAHHEGTVKIGLLIGKDGRVKTCDVLSSSGWSDLDEATCSQFRDYAIYNISTDAAGQPVEVHGTQTIVWKIPEH